MEEKQTRLVEAAPQIHHPDSTAKIMWTVSLCLAPAGIWGVYVFGIRVLAVLGVSILSAMLAEYGMARAAGRENPLGDGSAFLTGLLIGYNLPPAIPYHIPVLASLFAIVIVKWTFGGLGRNWMNPALAGRVFVFFSWTGEMTNWTMPRTMDAADTVSGASVLGFIKSGLIDYQGSARGPMEFLRGSGYPQSSADVRATEWLRGIFGEGVPGGYWDLFVGNVPGSLGEVSALLLLLGAAYLLYRKIITWEIPVSYLLSFSLLVWIFGGFDFNAGIFSGDVFFHLFSGGLILGAFYMATDMVTSPLSRRGMLIYGVGVGFFTFLIRIYGSFPEGVSLAIILMNIFVPMINRYSTRRIFGVAEEKGSSV
ncbi:MAG TPA: RnfABCDGE type electron transport complex subunit D [Sediminispirochaeta sp.]|nr:RnfABCDGE type electron transport complex subunit D [Sediminispirochaeta sp.]